MQLHAPQQVATVANEEFQLRGQKMVYGCILDALDAAKANGVGGEVIRLSDGKTVATVPGRILASPQRY